MHDTITLEPMFLTPEVAIKEMRRCEAIANEFARLAANPHSEHPTAATISREYRARAASLRQIAQPTAPRVTA